MAYAWKTRTERTDAYRTIRLLLYPTDKGTHWSLVAVRTVRGNSSGRILARGALDGDRDYSSVGALLLAVSDDIVEVAARLED